MGHNTMTDRKPPIVCGFLIAAALVVARLDAAAPITIDFEGLRVDDALLHFVGPVYAVDGFIFTASVPPGSGNTPGFNTFGTLAPSFVGSTPLFNLNGFGGTTLTRSDQAHVQHSLDILAETPNFDEFGNPVNLGSFSLTFVGVRANGSTVQATATIDPFPAVTTFRFPGFINLVSVMWFQGGGGSQGLTHQFDNVRVMPQ